MIVFKDRSLICGKCLSTDLAYKRAAHTWCSGEGVGASVGDGVHCRRQPVGTVVHTAHEGSRKTTGYIIPYTPSVTSYFYVNGQQLAFSICANLVEKKSDLITHHSLSQSLTETTGSKFNVVTNFQKY